MSAIVNFSLDLSKLPKEKIVKGKKGTYINLSMSLNDQTNAYGQNASVTVAQSKEERDAKEDRVYVGNGKVAWTDGSIAKAEAQDAVVEEVADADLPF